MPIGKTYNGLRYVDSRTDGRRYNAFVVIMQTLGMVAYALGIAVCGFAGIAAEKLKAPPKKVA